MTLERRMDHAVTLAHAQVQRSESGEVTLTYGSGEELRCAVGASEKEASQEEHARALRRALVCYFPPDADLRTSPPDRVTVEGTHYLITKVERMERFGRRRALKAHLEEVA